MIGALYRPARVRVRPGRLPGFIETRRPSHALRSRDRRAAGAAANAETTNAAIAGWRTVIGLELHVQLASSRKLFSRALPDARDAPNTAIAALDAAVPGVLPIIEPECVQLAIRAALALRAQIALESRFDRKHYFYADLPKGYQITQQHVPFAEHGHVSIDRGRAPVAIQRLQLEQDTAKSTEDPQTDGVLINLNRVGAPLIEIVTAPELSSAADAVAFVRALRALLRHARVSTGNMEEVRLSRQTDRRAPCAAM